MAAPNTDRPWFVLPMPLPAPPAPAPSVASRTARAMLLAAAAASAGLLLNLACRARRRQMVLRSTRSDEQVHHHLLHDAAPVSVAPHPSLARSVARALRQRAAGESRALDLRATVDATIDAQGAFSPRWQQLHRMPEYLVLIEQRHGADHLTALAQAWVDALERAGVVLQRFCFDGTPAAGCWPHGPAAAADPMARQRVALAELCTRAAGRRLLVFADSRLCIERGSGQPQPWLKVLSPLAERAWFTPRPLAQWSAAEDAADAAGFAVLPLQEAALNTLAQAFSGAALSFTPDIDTPGPLPAALQDSALSWVDSDEPPPPEAQQALVRDLRRWLGAMRLQWLAACALLPQLTPPLTLALGQQVLRGRVADAERSLALGLAAFCALPWFRQGCMPLWLRQALQQQLSPQQLSELDGVVQQRLGQALDGSRTAGSSAPLADVATRIKAWLRRRRPAAQDLLLADFLQRKDRVNQWLRRLPEGLRRRLFRHGQPALGLRPPVMAAPVALLLAGLLAATPLWQVLLPDEEGSPLPFLAHLEAATTLSKQVRMSFLGEWTLRLVDDAGTVALATLPNAPRMSPRFEELMVSENFQAGTVERSDAVLSIAAASGAPLLSYQRGERLRTVPLSVEPGQRALALSFTPSGRRVVGWMSDGRVRVWGLPRIEYVLLDCGGQIASSTLAERVAAVALAHATAVAEFNPQVSLEFVGMTETLWTRLHPDAPTRMPPGDVRYGTGLNDPGDRVWLQRPGVTLRPEPTLIDTVVSSDCRETPAIQAPPDDVAEPRIPGLTLAQQAALSARVARMFGPSREDRVAATTELSADNDALSDAITLALPRAARILQPSRLPMTDQRASGVINTLVLLQAATPATLNRQRAAIEALLPRAAAVGKQTQTQVQAVSKALEDASGMLPLVDIHQAREAQQALVDALLPALKRAGYAVEIRRGTPWTVRSTKLRLVGASDRPRARQLAQLLAGVARLGPVDLLTTMRSSKGPDVYELWLDPELCLRRAEPACGASATEWAPLEVNWQALTRGSLQPARVGEPYRAQLVRGGRLPFRVSQLTKLPLGLYVADGILLGMPERAGLYKLEIVVQDDDDQFVQVTTQLEIRPDSAPIDNKAAPASNR